MRTKITPPKFEVGQKVYAYTKEGMALVTIERAHISISDRGQTISYWINYETYAESQLFENYQRATKRLADNSNQLSLLLT